MKAMISRRKFLGGASALVGLPLLESLLPREARAQSASPQRFVSFYVPNGMYVPHWLPDIVGPNYDLKMAFAPLAPIQSDVTVISNLANMNAELHGEDGAHARGTGSFLTCTQISKSEDRLGDGISLDQTLVQALAPPTRLSSLQIGLDGGDYSSSCDAGYSCAYQRTISWAGPASPLPMIISPRVLFDRMFAGSDAAASAAERAREKRLKKSVLDAVRAEAEAIETKLDSADRRKLDEYFTGLRELELRLTPPPPTGTCVAPELSAMDPKDDRAAHARAMCDLMVAAIQCDMTRVLTFMLATSASNRSYEFIGVHGDHHDASHHDDDAENLEIYGRICAWEVEQFAYVVERLKAIEENGAPLLDQCALFFSSEISDGNKHDHVNLPVLLAGRAGGAFHPGRHIRAREEEPIANFYLAILQAFGTGATSFGADGTSPLGDL